MPERLFSTSEEIAHDHEEYHNSIPKRLNTDINTRKIDKHSEPVSAGMRALEPVPFISEQPVTERGIP